MKVCLTRNIPGPALDLLKEKGYEVSVSLRDHPLNAGELLEFVSAADAIIPLLTDKIDATVFDAAGPQLKIVANYAIGFDNVDLIEAQKRGVVVTNTPSEIITQSVAEHTFALMLALAKRVVEADQFVRAGRYHCWDPNLFIGTQLLNKTLGIVGLGRIGSVVAKAASRGLGMKVLYTGPNRKTDFEKEYEAEFKSLDDLLSLSDFVTLHVPATAETHHLINRDRLRLMKSSAFLINTARGSVVGEKDLVEALSNNVIKGVALDVCEDEENVSPKLRELKNVVLTPHIASATKEARQEMSRLAAANVIEVLEGRKPLNPAFISD